MYRKNIVRTGIIVDVDRYGFSLKSPDGLYLVEYNKGRVKKGETVKVLGNTYKPGLILDADIEYLNS